MLRRVLLGAGLSYIDFTWSVSHRSRPNCSLACHALWGEIFLLDPDVLRLHVAIGDPTMREMCAGSNLSYHLHPDAYTSKLVGFDVRLYFRWKMSIQTFADELTFYRFIFGVCSARCECHTTLGNLLAPGNIRTYKVHKFRHGQVTFR